MTVREESLTLMALGLAAVLGLGTYFVAHKIKNDSTIAADTARIAAALEALTARPFPAKLRP